jgi:hypothetical protein
MIVVFLRGGLGNQMFQYAAARALAKKYGAEVRFDTTFLNDRFPRGKVAFYHFDLDIFGIAPRFTLLSVISQAAPIPGVWLGIDLALMKARDAFGIRKIFKELSSGEFASSAFDPAMLTAGGNVLLWGYWQSEKYFEGVKDDIRKEFRFATALTGEAARIAEEIKRTNSVSLHVRRGDYAAIKSVVKIMGETNLPYYAAAVAHIGERVKDPHFFIVSNDPAWCRENIKIPFATTYLDDASAGPKNAYHLELMSLCKHNIIANSTYSWWAAWLNANPEKIVIAPKKWFNDPSMSSGDIIPAGWVAL